MIKWKHWHAQSFYHLIRRLVRPVSQSFAHINSNNELCATGISMVENPYRRCRTHVHEMPTKQWCHLYPDFISFHNGETIFRLCLLVHLMHALGPSRVRVPLDVSRFVSFTIIISLSCCKRALIKWVKMKAWPYAEPSPNNPCFSIGSLRKLAVLKRPTRFYSFKKIHIKKRVYKINVRKSVTCYHILTQLLQESIDNMSKNGELVCLFSQ